VQALEEPANLDRRDRFVSGRAAQVVEPMLREIAALLHSAS
jgi:hypothetical protein